MHPSHEEHSICQNFLLLHLMKVKTSFQDKRKKIYLVQLWSLIRWKFLWLRQAIFQWWRQIIWKDTLKCRVNLRLNVVLQVWIEPKCFLFAIHRKLKEQIIFNIPYLDSTNWENLKFSGDIVTLRFLERSLLKDGLASTYHLYQAKESLGVQRLSSLKKDAFCSTCLFAS